MNVLEYLNTRIMMVNGVPISDEKIDEMGEFEKEHPALKFPEIQISKEGEEE